MQIINLNASGTLVTYRKSGHFLNHRQVFSADRNSVFFDGRNDESKIASTRTIERLDLASCEIEIVYETNTPSEFGPGVGAVTCHPTENRILFIHGLRNCCEQQPYSMSRRFGGILQLDAPNATIESMETRSLELPRLLGSLSGGTHAHSWSPTGTRISFTYNDAIEPTMLRTVGFADVAIPAPDSHSLKPFDDENFPGLYASFLIAIPEFTDNRTFEIDQPFASQSSLDVADRFVHACEECWLDDNRIAFLGTLQPAETSVSIQTDSTSNKLVEVYLAELEEASHAPTFDLAGSLEVTAPKIKLRRLTRSAGIDGPRHWLISSLSGDRVYSMARDCNNVVQLIQISTTTGEITWLTSLESSISGPLSIDPEGNQIAFLRGGEIHIYCLDDRRLSIITHIDWTLDDEIKNRLLKDSAPAGTVRDQNFDEGEFLGAIHFLDKRTLIANRWVTIDNERSIQIARVEIL